MSEKRYYYRSIDYREWYSLKTPDYAGKDNYIEITEEQWNEHLAEIDAKRRKKKGE